MPREVVAQLGEGRNVGDEDFVIVSQRVRVFPNETASLSIVFQNLYYIYISISFIFFQNGESIIKAHY